MCRKESIVSKPFSSSFTPSNNLLSFVFISLPCQPFLSGRWRSSRWRTTICLHCSTARAGPRQTSSWWKLCRWEQCSWANIRFISLEDFDSCLRQSRIFLLLGTANPMMSTILPKLTLNSRMRSPQKCIYNKLTCFNQAPQISSLLNRPKALRKVVAKEVSSYLFENSQFSKWTHFLSSQWEKMTFVTEELVGETSTTGSVAGESSTLVNFIFKDGLCIWTKVLFKQQKWSWLMWSPWYIFICLSVT